MLTTVVVVVATRGLSLGVLAGVLLSGIFSADKVQRMFAVEREESADGVWATYPVTGEIFFASVDRFTCAFPNGRVRPRVVIDLTEAHSWGISGVGALDYIVARLRWDGCVVEVIGYTRTSAALVDRFARHDKTGVEKG